MIKRLEELLDEQPVTLKTFGCPAEDIVNAVNETFNTNCTEQTRRKRVVYARHMAIYLIRKHTDLSLEESANAVGLTDHATALHSVRTAKNLMQTDEEYLEKHNIIAMKLKQNYTDLVE